MSFNKLQDFEAQAKALEEQYFDANGKARAEEVVSTPEPVAVADPTPVPVAPETTTTEVVTPPEPPKALVEEEKYKASVKAMNEAQREAAELRKREEAYAKKQAELEERLNELVRKSRVAPVPEEEEDNLEVDMPEVAKIAERKATAAEKRLSEKLEALQSKLETLEKTRAEADAADRSIKMRNAVIAAHPDFDEVVNSEAMVAWVNNEAPPIFKAIYDGSVPFSERDVIAVVSQFKNTLAPKAATPAKPSAADMAAPVRTSPVVQTGSPEDVPITEAELNDFMHNAQRKSQAELDAFNARLERAYGK